MIVSAIVIALCLIGFFLYATWSRPHLLVGLTLLEILFARTLTRLTGVAQVDSVDDLLVLLCAFRATIYWLQVGRYRPRQSTYPGLPFFVAFIAIGVTSAVVQPDFNAKATLAGTVLASKAIILGWSIAQFEWTSDDVRTLAKRGLYVLITVLILAVPSAVAPYQTASILSANGGVVTRYGLPSLTGPFVHPFDLAFTASMGAIAVLAYRAHVRKTNANAILFWLLSLVTFATFRRKDLLGLFAAGVVTVRRAPSRLWLVVTLLATVGTLILAWTPISEQAKSIRADYLTVNSGEARTVLTIDGFKVATSHFPLGAGFGRFGSRTAAVNYSPEYVRLGYPTRYGLGPGTRGFFLTDTSWPAIVGETGLLGLLLFATGIALQVRRGIKFERRGLSAETRWLGAVIVGWGVLTIFQSTGAAVFTSPPMFAFFFGVCGLATAAARDEQALGTRSDHTVGRWAKVKGGHA